MVAVRQRPQPPNHHVLVMDAFVQQAEFVVTTGAVTEKDQPTHDTPELVVGSTCIVEKSEFMVNWKVLTNKRHV